PHTDNFNVYPDFHPERNVSLPALIHEYGHAVFEHNFHLLLDREALSLPWLKPLWEAKLRIEGMIRDREGWIRDRKRLAVRDWDTENEIKRFEKEIGDLKALRLSDIEMKIATALRLYKHPVDFLALRRTRNTVWQTA